MIKNLPANAGDADSIPGLGRSPGEGNGNPLQYSCLGNHMDRGAWQVTVHGDRKELDMTEHEASLPYNLVRQVLLLSPHFMVEKTEARKAK